LIASDVFVGAYTRQSVIENAGRPYAQLERTLNFVDYEKLVFASRHIRDYAAPRGITVMVWTASLRGAVHPSPLFFG